MQIRRPRCSPGGQRGFTLGEVLTTLAIAGVSLSLVVPSLASVARSNRLAGAVNELVGTLQVARSEAITRNSTVVVCPSTDGVSCSPVAWESGWIRFVDRNGDYRTNSGETVLGVTPPVANLRIRTGTFAEAFGYGPTGRPATPDSGPAGGDFTFCPGSDGADAQVVLITPAGRPVLAEHLADGREPDCSPG